MSRGQQGLAAQCAGHRHGQGSFPSGAFSALLRRARRLAGAKRQALRDAAPPPPCRCRMTNQRLMAQYGFVPAGGNTADRIAFACLTEDNAAAAGGGGGPEAAATAGASLAGGRVLLSLDRLQSCLGDGEAMAAALSGRSPYLYAALKVGRLVLLS